MHGLANLLWRLRRATAIEMGLFDIQAEFLHACRSRSATYLVNRTPSKLPLEPMVRRTAMAQIEDIIRRPVTKNHHYFPSIRSYDDHQTPVPWRNASCASPTSTRRCLRGWAPGCGRQAAQIIWTLDAIRRPAAAPARPRFRKPIARYFWNWDRRIGHSDWRWARSSLLQGQSRGALKHGGYSSTAVLPGEIRPSSNICDRLSWSNSRPGDRSKKILPPRPEIIFTFNAI